MFPAAYVTFLYHARDEHVDFGPPSVRPHVVNLHSGVSGVIHLPLEQFEFSIQHSSPTLPCLF